MKRQSFAIMIFVIIVLLFTTVYLNLKLVEESPAGSEDSMAFLSEEEVIKLDGSWDFYWQTFLSEINTDEEIPLPKRLKVPLDWTDYDYQKHGYATYVKTIEISDTYKNIPLALYVTSSASAHRVYVDDEEILELGKPGKNKSEEIPSQRTEIYYFETDQSEIKIAMEVSNFSQRRAGVWSAPLLGSAPKINNYNELVIIASLIISVSLFTMALYYLSVFTFRFKRLELLYFSLVCITMAVRTISLNERLLVQFFSFLNWVSIARIEYLTVSLGVLFFTLFVRTIYREDTSDKISLFIVYTMAGFSLFFLVTEPLIFTETMLFLQVSVLIIFIYFMKVSIQSYLNKRAGSKLQVGAMIFLTLLFTNDILYYNSLISTTELSSLGIVVLLFARSYQLSKEDSKAYHTAEVLSQELLKVNINLEEKIKARTEELNKSNLKLEEVNRSLSKVDEERRKWIQYLSHEMNSPLSVVQMYSQGMIDGVVPIEKENLEIVVEKSKYMSNLLIDLRTLSEIQSQFFSLKKEKTDFNHFVNKIIERYQRQLASEDINIIINRSLLDDVFVSIDPQRMEQVVINLLENSIKYSHHKGTITVSLLSRVGEIELRIEDQGIGISEEDQPHIFSRFFRSENARNNNIDGTGMGLTICKEIIDKHNGQIIVESVKGKGSTFSINLSLI